MSQESCSHQASRWLDTAREDFRAAETLAAAGHFSHACFTAQQAAEKAVKALWYLGDDDPWGHSVQKLIYQLPDPGARSELDAYIEDGARLDRYYIPTRYPNGLPDLTPGQAYFEDDARQALDAAGRIIHAVSAIMDDKEQAR